MNSIENEVLNLIGEDTTSPDVFTEANITPIRDSVNAGLQEICMVTGSYTRQYLLPLFEGQLLYRLDMLMDHYGYVVEAWDRNRKVPLIQTDVLALTQADPWWLKTDHTGPPTHYMHVGHRYLGVYRRPSANGDVLEVTCVCIPKAYTADTDPIKVREAFRRAVVDYAVSEYYASRGDANRATEYLNLYLEAVGLTSLHPQQAERQFQYGNTNWNNRLQAR